MTTNKNAPSHTTGFLALAGIIGGIVGLMFLFGSVISSIESCPKRTTSATCMAKR